MINHIIKICGIRDTETAEKTSQLGIDYIGLVFHPLSRRHVTIKQAISICKTIRKFNVLPVAVFVNHTAQEMQSICDATNISIIQLHGHVARAEHHLLPKAYQRIYVLNVNETGELVSENELVNLDPLRDMILVDHHEPGLGKLINHTKLHYALTFPWLIAGGLTPHNVADVIQQLKPSGVDVSTGVENFHQQKDIFLIQQFVTAVREQS
ncbi:MAG TPA: phosphoribosylanthranilate isomerase [Gammaproteobacteria bacterium]|jgi:phosphoribosylanthranilate isomerase|nr:phosphoribosylanthranilate isomerase [Gammaproteobacteria bacterium]